MKAILLSLIIIFSLTTVSQADDRPGIVTDADGNPIGFTNDPVPESSVGDGSMSDENLNEASGFENATSGAEQNAQESASSSGMTQAIGMMMGAAFMMMCNKPPGNIAPCILGAMSFMDAAASGGNKGNSINFGNSLLPGGDDADSTGGGTQDPVVQEAKAQLQALEGMGFVSNADGSVTAPNGETFSGGDFGSSEGLQAKGISGSQADAALDLLKSTQAKAAEEANKKGGRAIASVSAASADGSGGVAPLPDLIVDEGAPGGKRRKGVKRMTASEAAKLSKNFNGTPIGISLANIFTIVEKKYDEKEKQKAFFNKEY